MCYSAEQQPTKYVSGAPCFYDPFVFGGNFYFYHILCEILYFPSLYCLLKLSWITLGLIYKLFIPFEPVSLQ